MLAVFRHDALGPELAGMGEDGRAVALQVLAIWIPTGALARSFASRALRSSSGRGRQSSPSNSRRSKA